MEKSLLVLIGEKLILCMLRLSTEAAEDPNNFHIYSLWIEHAYRMTLFMTNCIMQPDDATAKDLKSNNCTFFYW